MKETKDKEGSMTGKHVFIPPGTLLRGRGRGLSTSRSTCSSNYIGSKVSIKEKNDKRASKSSQRSVSEAIKGLVLGNPGKMMLHNLLFYFENGKIELELEVDPDKYTYMDMLETCSKHLDIYTVGMNIMYGDEMRVTCDADLLQMFQESHKEENIHIFVYEDNSTCPVPFKLPKHVEGPGKEMRDHGHDDSVHIGCTEKEIENQSNDDSQCLPDDPLIDEIAPQPNEVEPHPHQSPRKKKARVENDEKRVRGMNKNKRVAALKNDDRLEVTFYKNRAVGPNHEAFSRHLGRIVRDFNICPIRVHSWKEIGEQEKSHMWAAIKEKFKNDNMEDHREDALCHMRSLWNNWRSSLNRKYVKPYNSIQDILKKKPEEIQDQQDWEWLVKNHFQALSFKEKSKRNSKNRENLRMAHRTRSKPMREIAYQMGGKNGHEPNLADMWFATRKKCEKLVESKEQETYDQLVQIIQSNPDMSNLEIIETCFGPQLKNHVLLYGGGVRPKELKPTTSRKNELEEENRRLKDRVEALEVAFKEFMQSRTQDQPSTSQPTQVNETTEL